MSEYENLPHFQSKDEEIFDTYLVQKLSSKIIKLTEEEMMI